MNTCFDNRQTLSIFVVPRTRLYFRLVWEVNSKIVQLIGIVTRICTCDYLEVLWDSLYERYVITIYRLPCYTTDILHFLIRLTSKSFKWHLYSFVCIFNVLLT
jgi:hypothetical protein